MHYGSTKCQFMTICSASFIVFGAPKPVCHAGTISRKQPGALPDDIFKDI